MRGTGRTPTTDRLILPGFATAALFAIGAIASAGFERLILAVVAAMFTLVLLLVRSRGTSLHGAVRVVTTLFGALVTVGGSFGVLAGGWLFLQGGMGLLAGAVVVPVAAILTTLGWVLFKAGRHSP
jgi:hypothetical protein